MEKGESSVISNRGTVVRRFLLLMVTAPLLVVGLPGLAHAGGPATQLIIDDPDPVDPPPPCPERTDFTQDFSQEMKTPKVERPSPGTTYLVTFTLQPAHAFNPPDPNGCTGSDRVVSKLGIPSTNIVSGPTTFLDQQVAKKELTPDNYGLPMVYHFKVLFQKNFNNNGGVLNPKRDARWCLVIPVMAPGAPSQNIAPYQCQA